MAGGHVADRIRSGQCFGLLLGDFHLFFSLVFSHLKLSGENEAASDNPAPDKSQRSHLALVVWPEKPMDWWLLLQHCTVTTDLSCFCLDELMLPYGTVLGGCVRWGALLRRQLCWFRPTLNAISPNVSCASFQPQSIYSHGEAAECWLYECDGDIWVESCIQSPCRRFLSEEPLLSHQLEFRAKVYIPPGCILTWLLTCSKQPVWEQECMQIPQAIILY